MTKTRHVSPSRIRYEKAHPTISVRLTETLKGQLDLIKNRINLGYSDIIMKALRDQLKDEWFDEGFNSGRSEGRKEGYIDGLTKGFEDGYSDGLKDGEQKGRNAGIQEGYEKGKSEYAVVYPCSVCGKQLVAKHRDPDYGEAVQHPISNQGKHKGCGEHQLVLNDADQATVDKPTLGFLDRVSN